MVSPTRAVRSAASRLGSTNELGSFAATVLTLLAALAFASVGLEIGALVLIGVSVIGELSFESKPSTAATLLDQAAFGAPMRFALRAFAAVVASEHMDSQAALGVWVMASLAYAVVVCGRTLHQQYRLLGPLKPMETRNIPGAPRIAELPPQRAAELTATQLLVLVPALLGAPWPVVLLTALAAVGALALTVARDFAQSWAMRTAKRATGFTGPLRQIQDFLDERQPEVIVHLSGPAASAYQINTWLEALEHTERRVFIVVRDQPLFDNIAPTSLPILSLRDPGELLMLDFSSARVALYPANTGNNIHLLRLPTLMSAFIGHGDSDKSASSNPFSRAYDELWVAGQAGADRYRRSQLGIHEDQYRFVGRPQVHAISREPQLGDDPVPTVLYAPTWEGVNMEQEYSSVRAVGEQIVEKLLAAQPPVRVVFKAHPFTGQRDAKYRATLAAIERRIDAAALASGIDHRVVKGGPILEWFNRASALITDVSSVVSDFVASEKPYAVFNHCGRSAEQFVQDYPSTSASTVIGPDGSGIAEFIDVVTGRAPDEHATARKALATHLLGPAEQRTLEAFSDAIDQLIARCERERAHYRTTDPR